MNPDFFRLGHIDKALYIKMYTDEIIRRLLSLRVAVPQELYNFVFHANSYANSILDMYVNDMVDGVYMPSVFERSIIHQRMDGLAPILSNMIVQMNTHCYTMQRMS